MSILNMSDKHSNSSKSPNMREILKRLEDIERRANIVENFEETISDLREQINKMVTISINLQAKVTELLIKMTDLTENVTEMVDLLKEASELEEEGSPGAQMNIEPIVNELKELGKHNIDVVKSIKTLNDYLKKMYTRQLIGKVVKDNYNEQGGNYTL